MAANATAILETSVDLPPDVAFDLAVEAVQDWGGEVDPAGLSNRQGPLKVQLPVSAGLRYGWIDAYLSTHHTGSSCRIVLQVEDSHYHLHTSAVMVLLLGGLGGLSMLIMPLFPQLFELLPLAGLLLVLAWFMVASKVKHHDAQDFLRELEHRAASVATAAVDGSSPSS